MIKIILLISDDGLENWIQFDGCIHTYFEAGKLSIFLFVIDCCHIKFSADIVAALQRYKVALHNEFSQQ